MRSICVWEDSDGKVCNVMLTSSVDGKTWHHLSGKVIRHNPKPGRVVHTCTIRYRNCPMCKEGIPSQPIPEPE